MDKFITEQLELIKGYAEDLQSCFIDEDAYSRTPNAAEWRRAGRIVRQITLACCELSGYANARRCIEATFIRERLQIFQNEKTPLALAQEVDFLKPDEGESSGSEQGFVEFTKKEIQQMPKQLQRIIIVNRKRCRIRRKNTGANSFTYEIRFRSNGYNVSACGKTKELAKANMLAKLQTAQPKDKAKNYSSVPTTFNAFSRFYFERFRKAMVSVETFRTDFNRYQKHLQPHFQEKPIAWITPSDCQDLLDKIEEEGKGRTVDELYCLMSIIFKAAIAHNLIERNPLATVLHVSHERENGCALSHEEEEGLFARLEEPTFAVALALSLYCGLRPSEVQTAEIDGDFIKAENKKQKRKKNAKGRKIVYKWIPITDRLRPFLVGGLPELPTPQLFRRRAKAALPNHKLYDLRTTFQTRCRACNVADNALKAMMGHSFGTLGNAYTDITQLKAYLLEEGKKLKKW